MNNINNINNIIDSNPDLQFVPVQENKRPLAGHTYEWQNTKKRYNCFDHKDCWGIGLVCGKLSGNVEVIDIDCKYDLTGSLYRDLSDFIHGQDKTIMPLLVTQETMNGGFHLIYRCEVIEGNKALAKRFTTEEERANNPHEKKKVLIETRGEGGQICCYPTPGYKFTHLSLKEIKTITPKQRELILNACRYFNEVFEENESIPFKAKIESTGKSPFDDYDERGPVIDLLQSHGWTQVKTRGSKIHFRRPGETVAETSGNFDIRLNRFSVFSTSTQFTSQKAYKPYAVYAVLECNGDYQEASKRLREQGYGDSMKAVDYQSFPKNGEKEKKPVFNPKSIGSYSFEKWMHDVKNQPPSLKTGITGLDEKILIPQGAITLIAGRPQHGKTTLLMNLCLSMMEINPGKKFYFFSYEEQARAIALKMLNITINKPILRDFKRESGFEDCKTNLHVLKEYIRHGKVDYTEVEKGLINIKEKLDSGRLNIIDMPLTVEDLAVFISQANQENNIGGIFIDYIQKITTKDPFKDMRLKITHISNFILQEIAKKTGLPIILGAQFNRSAADKEEPRASELKEAGALEEDANLILGLFNEYATFDKKEKTEKGDPVRQRIAINILKNRDGENSIPFDLYLNGQTGRFS